MSKIICDVCGTSYAESSSQCPVCGCARPGDAQQVKSSRSGSGNYTHVKGGRFSKSNVSKRNSGTKKGSTGRKTAARKNEKQDEKSGKGLAIVAILLLLAILAVVAYLAVTIFFPAAPADPTDPTVPTVTDPTTESLIPCTDITLDIATVTFAEKGEARLLWVTVTPSDTTDVVTYRSEDESIATVTTTGKIEAIAGGNTKIIITCGDIVKECIVVCDFAEETDPTEPSVEPTDPPTDPTEPELVLSMNRFDITFSFEGEGWYIYNGTVPTEQITWRSDDESVAVIANGEVTAVGPGTTNVYAEFEDKSVSCIIRCSFDKEDGPVGGTGGVGEDGGEEKPTYAIYTFYGDKRSDITINVGETQQLFLSDGNGNDFDAVWEAESDVITVEGNAVTGAKSGTTSVIATYEGKTYKCIVRVR